MKEQSMFNKKYLSVILHSFMKKSYFFIMYCDSIFVMNDNWLLKIRNRVSPFLVYYILLPSVVIVYRNVKFRQLLKICSHMQYKILIF